MESSGAENNGGVLVRGEEGLEEDDQEMLKKRISGHPLYGLLIQTHLNCLKVGLGDAGHEFDITIALNQAGHNRTNPSSSDLDEFMEVYCMALNKLKEAMEKPLQETSTFIDAMYVQLDDLSVTSEPPSSFRSEKI